MQAVNGVGFYVHGMFAAALVVAATICLQPGDETNCLAEAVLSNVGDQLMRHIPPDDRDLEQAAFLTKSPDGTLGCRLWPITTERAASTFHGKVPSDAIAVIHTHPHEWFDPSRGAGLLSQRVQMPVLIITHRWLSLVSPSGRSVRWPRYGGDHIASPVCQPIAQ